jgi:hypothetical protein
MKILPRQVTDVHDVSQMKRSEQVGVRLSEADLKLMRKAADKLWAGMPITNSTLLLTLARLKAQEVLRATRPR